LADGVSITAGAGTTVATDDIGGVHYQRVKPTWGADGTANDVNATTPLPVQETPVTSGGCSIYRRISTASTNAETAKASAGQVYGVIAVNTNASARYLKLYNTSSAPTVGTTTPVITIPLPGAGGVSFSLVQGIPFATGISIAITSGAADSDTGSVAANEQIVTLLYK